MSNINTIILNIFYEDEEEDSWSKKKKIGLALGGALLGGALASQTHTGKAIYHGVKAKLSSNLGTKLSSGTQAIYHGIRSPLLRKPIINTAGKFLAKTAAAGGTIGGLAYGAKKAYNYSQTPEGQQKISDLKNKVSGWFNNNQQNPSEQK